MTIKELTPSQTELFDACRRGEYDKVRLWLSAKKHKRPRTPLNIFRPSTPSNWLVTVKDPSTFYTPLHYSALNGHEHVSKLLLDFEPQLACCKDKRGCVPLHLAAWNGHLNIVKMLIHVEPQSVDATNSALETPLHLASQHAHAPVVKLLLEKHANPRLRNARHECALDIAARVGHSMVVKLITAYCPELALQSAVDASATGEGDGGNVVYPLHAAARHSHIECLQILRNAGFEINFVTEEGSALHVAAMFGQVDAVRYLISEGINTDICNSRGQTVLDLLNELEHQRGSDMTQIIQSRDGWANCRSLIEEGTNRLQSDQLNSSSDSGIDRRDSERFTRRSQSVEHDREVIWKQLPANASVQYYKDQRKQPQNSFIYNRPPSISADIRDTSPGGSNEGDLSVTSDNSYPNSTINRTWNSRMYDRGGVPRFPVTSPFNKSRHNTSQRTSDTLPTSFFGARTKPVAQRATILPSKNNENGCVYREPPPQYDAWKSSRVVDRHGATHTYNPSAMPYDNVPKHLSVYDNAVPNEKQWSHACGSMGRTASAKISVHKPIDGCQTLPAGRVRTRATIGQSTFSAINEPSQKSIPKRRIHGSRTACEREESLGLTQSPRLDTRASSIISSLTLASSTFERSASPSVHAMQQGRAPLAMPEEMTGSTTNSIIGHSVTPDRESRENSITIISNIGDNNSSANSTLLRDANFESSVCPLSPDSPPSPNTSQAQIFDALYGSTAHRDRSIRSKVSQPLSPATTDCSDSTVASSCSLQGISQISVTPPSSQSPNRNKNNNSIKDFNQESPSIEVRLRPGYQDISSKNSSNRSINIADELKQIDDLFASLAVPCPSARTYEPQVAVFSRDRRSQALTLQLVNSPFNTRPSSIEMEKDRKHPTNILTISEWLEMKVGLAPVAARDIGALLTKYGYDKYTQLKGSLTPATIAQIGIPHSSQTKILKSIDLLEDNRPNACTFNYVSDWLCSLELTDYLGNFVNEGFKSMVIVRTSNINEQHLQRMGIVIPGHVARILYSLRCAKELSEEQARQRKELIRQAVQLPTDYEPLESDIMRRSRTESPDLDASLKQNELLNGGVLFSAHFLGCKEISNIDGTEESRRVMDKMKKSIREIINIPQVFLEISVQGVRILDHMRKNVSAVHEVSRIQIVCQDERDLNCFTYITQDGEKHFCHVFCVLTADVATEIIVTLGQAFELAFKIQNGLPVDNPVEQPQQLLQQ